MINNALKSVKFTEKSVKFTEKGVKFTEKSVNFTEKSVQKKVKCLCGPNTLPYHVQYGISNILFFRSYDQCHF